MGEEKQFLDLQAKYLESKVKEVKKKKHNSFIKRWIKKHALEVRDFYSFIKKNED